MRIFSFNVNGVRARPHQLKQLVESYQPDIVGLQETKVQDADFPQAIFDDLGYQINYFGQKGHYGVAIMSRQAPQVVHKGFDGDGEEDQKRIISAQFQLADGSPLTVINGYFPQGESRDHETKFPAKLKFYADLQTHLQQHHTPADNLLVIGDVNIAPADADIGIGADNAKRWLRSGKCSFLPEERDMLEKLKGWGLEDCYRNIHPDVDNGFSWFDYRSKGFDREPKRGLRIDLILATSSLLQKCSDAGIAYDIRAMEKPSDHCPIWADFDLQLA
ncbi:MAG: exodeoxyribonuclease III [gamma proteobacterium symbiont of Bathyaustriella thionipta]|nr:exodeoxyribonuclease III [gamma proteobacterium symbiont of Bathyaustriella thionipta]